MKRRQKVIKSRIRALECHNPDSERIDFLKSSLDNLNASIKSRLLLNRLKEEEKAVAAIKKNPSYFYSYAKKFSRVKSKIGPLKDDQGYFVSDPKQMANMLQRQFCSVFSDPNAKSITEPSFPPAITSLEDIQVIL